MNQEIKDIITNIEEYSNKDLKLLIKAIGKEQETRFMNKFPKT